MAAMGWCPVCEISLYLTEPSEPHPEVCRTCLASVIGQDVICPECVNRALLMEPYNNQQQERLLERIVNRTLIALTEEMLSQPILTFPICNHKIAIPKLLGRKAALVECG